MANTNYWHKYNRQALFASVSGLKIFHTIVTRAWRQALYDVTFGCDFRGQSGWTCATNATIKMMSATR